jgi:hypothetical protein
MSRSLREDIRRSVEDVRTASRSSGGRSRTEGSYAHARRLTEQTCRRDHEPVMNAVPHESRKKDQ